MACEMTFCKKSMLELYKDIQKAKEIEASRSELGKATDAAKESLKKIHRLEDFMFYYARNITDLKKRNGELTAEVAELNMKNNALRAEMAASAWDKKACEKQIMDLSRKCEVLEKKIKSQKEQMSKAADLTIDSSVGLTPRPSLSRSSITPSVHRTLVFTPHSCSSPKDEENTLCISAMDDHDAEDFCDIIETPLCRPKPRRNRSLSKVRGILKAARRSFSNDHRAKLDNTLEVEKKKKVLF